MAACLQDVRYLLAEKARKNNNNNNVAWVYLLLQLREEQAQIVAKHGTGFSRAAMAEMRYADAVAREVLRIWGPAEFLFRQVVHY